jgi:transposase-like protein
LTNAAPAKTGRKEDTAMRGQSRAERRRSRRAEEKGQAHWAALEEYARAKIQGWVQELLEEEMTEFLGREKSERRAAVDAGEGYRNG